MPHIDDIPLMKYMVLSKNMCLMNAYKGAVWVLSTLNTHDNAVCGKHSVFLNKNS